MLEKMRGVKRCCFYHNQIGRASLCICEVMYVYSVGVWLSWRFVVILEVCGYPGCVVILGVCGYPGGV